MSDDKVPDILIERAVELWCRALHRPKFDNGDKSEHGFIGSSLQYMLADKAREEAGDFDAAIERFRVELTTSLKFQRDHQGEDHGDKWPDGRPMDVYFDRHLGVDYHPDPTLKAAADKAGIPSRAFSIKSSVNLYSDDHVTSSFGYGAPHMCHYPLSGGRWLVCDLSGGDMPAIIAAVEAGLLPALTVEPATA